MAAVTASTPPRPRDEPRHRLGRLVTFNVLGHGATVGVAFIASVALARMLGPADRGLLAIMLLVSTLPVALCSFGLPVAMNYFASRSETPRGTITGHSLLYAAVLGAVFIPVSIFAAPLLADVFAQGRGGNAWILVGVLIPVTFLSFTTVNHLWGRLSMGFGNILSVASKFLHLGVVALAVGLAGLGVTGGLLASLAAATLIVAAGLPVVLRDGAPKFHWPTAKAMLRYGLLIQIGTVSLILNSRLDVLVLQGYRPLDEVGHYVVAATVAEIVTILSLGFQGGVLPLVARQDEEDRRRTTVSAVVHHGVLAVVAILVVAVVGPALILIVFGSQFADALVPMLILLPGMWFLGAGTVAAGDLQGRGRPGTASALALVAAAATVILDVLLIPPLGVAGAALASVAAYVCFGMLSMAILARVAGIPIRQLVVPTREDLARYPAAARAFAVRARRQMGRASSA